MKYLLSLLLAGCVPKLGFITKKFDSTNSPCIDGLVVNMDYHGCVSMQMIQVPGERVYRVYCQEKIQSNGWTDHMFYVSFGGQTGYNSESWQAICSDPLVDVYFTTPNFSPDVSTAEEIAPKQPQ